LTWSILTPRSACTQSEKVVLQFNELNKEFQGGGAFSRLLAVANELSKRCDIRSESAPWQSGSIVKPITDTRTNFPVANGKESELLALWL